MKLHIFLYDFLKIYIPASLFILIIFIATHSQVPLEKRHKQSPVIIPQPTPPKQVQTPQPRMSVQPAPPKKPATSPAAELEYYYEVELSSGKFMKVQKIVQNKDTITLIIEEGFTISLSKNDIKAIKRYKL